MWLGTKNLKEVEWGWLIQDGMLFPTTTDLPPAPKEILKMIKCECSGSCDSKKCTCHKNGMTCTMSCKNCKGVSCQNVENTVEDEEDERL